MNNLELVSYKEYPQDQYTKAVCTVCIDGKYNVSYGKKLSKEGKSWWAPATFFVNENGEKTPIDGFSMDSKKENEKLLEFVKQHAKAQGATSMSEVAEAQSLPF